MDLLQTPLPTLDDPRVVVPAPGAGPGNWAGAASAVLVDGVTYLTYRVRRPLPDGRGIATVVARSHDGIDLRAGLRGLPRRVRRRVLRAPGRAAAPRRRLAALPLLRHARLQALVDRGAGRRPARGPAHRSAHRRAPRRRRRSRSRTPSSRCATALWEMWLCEHPLTEPGEEDRMSTSYLTSSDGLAWTRHGTVLEPRPRHLGRPRRPGHHGALARPARGAVRRTPDRRGQLARDHLGRPRRRDRPAARRPRRAGAALARLRRRPALRHAPCRSPTARPGSTSSWPGPTGRTTSSRR